jgi:hypothetical protein
MAEILSSASNKSPTSGTHLTRVMRWQRLEGYEEYKFFIEQLREKEKALVERTQSITVSAQDREHAVYQLAGLRQAIHFVRTDREAAEKLLSEEIKKEDPNTPKHRPVI